VAESPVVQLAHVEITTPTPERTYWFFHDLLGMEETTRAGQSVYLRGYEDWYHHTLKVTEGPQAALGHVAWRVGSEADLEALARRLDHAGYGRGWADGDLGHGRTYRFVTPDGHPMELLWEVEYYQPPEAMRTVLRNRPQKRPLRGIPVRRIDHVNLMAREVGPVRDFFVEHLGFRLREEKIGQGGQVVGAWLSVSPLVHEVAVMRDATGARGRFHHVAYWYGYPQHLMDAADALVDYGMRIESGPGKHGTTQAYFLYVFEPGGVRVELFGDTGYLIFDPTWKTVVWDVSNESDLERSSIWFGGRLPETFYTYGVPSTAWEAAAAR
jgi:catechol 2,3-dioxygenase